MGKKGQVSCVEEPQLIYIATSPSRSWNPYPLHVDCAE